MLDVSRQRPWPGPKWDAFRVVLHGDERPSYVPVPDGHAVSYRESEPDGRILYYFGLPGRTVTPPGKRPRHEPTILEIERVEVSSDGLSPARLVADFHNDRLYLDIAEERSQSRLRDLLGALPLLQLKPHAGGRPRGHRPRTVLHS